MACPEKRLYIAIVKQAIKDFYKGTIDKELAGEKEIVCRWVTNEEGTFPLCSIAWGDPDILKEKLLNTFQRIENGQKLRPDLYPREQVASSRDSHNNSRR